MGKQIELLTKITANNEILVIPNAKSPYHPQNKPGTKAGRKEYSPFHAIGFKRSNTVCCDGSIPNEVFIRQLLHQLIHIADRMRCFSSQLPLWKWSLLSIRKYYR